MPQPILCASASLLVIDVQQGFTIMEQRGRRRNILDAIQMIGELLNAFRYRNSKVVHIRHSSVEKNSFFRYNNPGYSVISEAKEVTGEPVILKSTNSSFIGTNLDSILQASGVNTVIICGATTNHCCETTARMAGNMGYRTLFASDATWTFDLTCRDGTTIPAEFVHEMTLANLDGEFAEVLTAHKIIELLS